MCGRARGEDRSDQALDDGAALRSPRRWDRYADVVRGPSLLDLARGLGEVGLLDGAVETLDRALSQSDYLSGASFTAADLYVGAQLGWGMQFGTIERRPAFERYWERIGNRPAASSSYTASWTSRFHSVTSARCR